MAGIVEAQPALGGTADKHGEIDYSPTGTPPGEKAGIEQVEKQEERPAVDAETEKRLLRKLDMRIIPMVMWIYLMNFMDRVSIGNARLYGMEDDLGMGGDQYQIAVSLLFVTYVIFETPSNMIIKRLQPARYLSGLVFCWGMVATFSAFSQNFGGLIACRLLLGFFESGLFPGVILYLSMFYNKRNLALRQAYFYGMSAISGAVGGLVAYGIGELDGTAGWRGWRWIFVINGIPTVLTCGAALYLLPNSPETAKFLSEEDRRNLVTLRLSEIGQTAKGQLMDKKDVMDGVKDWKTYAFAIAQFVGLGMLYSFSVFLPSIIRGLDAGWSPQTIQALTVPVYVSGFSVYLFTAWYGDKIQQRGIFCISGLACSLVGYVFLIINHGFALSYIGTFVVALGLWTATGAAFTWVNNNNPRYGKRAFASGMQITIGNISGVVSPFLYSTETGPTYYPGYGATIGLLTLGIALYIALTIYFRMHNKKKLRGEYDYLMEGKTEEEIMELGERNPRYMYTI